MAQAPATAVNSSTQPTQSPFARRTHKSRIVSQSTVADTINPQANTTLVAPSVSVNPVLLQGHLPKPSPSNSSSPFARRGRPTQAPVPVPSVPVVQTPITQSPLTDLTGNTSVPIQPSPFSRRFMSDVATTQPIISPFTRRPPTMFPNPNIHKESSAAQHRQDPILPPHPQHQPPTEMTEPDDVASAATTKPSTTTSTSFQHDVADFKKANMTSSPATTKPSTSPDTDDAMQVDSSVSQPDVVKNESSKASELPICFSFADIPP